MPNGKERTTIALEYPFPGDRVFRYQAIQNLLGLLLKGPYEEYTTSRLAEIVDDTKATISKSSYQSFLPPQIS